MLELFIVNEEADNLKAIRAIFKEYEIELNENLYFQIFEKEIENPLTVYSNQYGFLLLTKYNNVVCYPKCCCKPPKKNLLFLTFFYLI